VFLLAKSKLGRVDHRTPALKGRGTVAMRKCLAAGLLAAVAIPGSALAACPFSYVYNYVSSPQPISIITGAAGAGTTTFQTSTAGAVSKVSGPGSLTTSAATRQISVQMAMSNCSNVNNAQNFTGCSDTPTVTIAAIGTPTGLNQSLKAFTAAYTGSSGSITSTTGSAPLTIHLSPSGTTYYAGWSFDLGYNLPISDAGGGLAGNGASTMAITITPSTAGCSANTTTAIVPTLVNTPLGITMLSSLSFGRLVPPTAGSGTVTYTPTSSGGGTVAVTGGIVALPSPAPSPGSFKIQGQQYKEVSVQLDSSVNLTHGSSTIVLTPMAVWGGDASNGSFNNGSNGAGQVNLGNANGAVTLYVGGSFTLTPTTPTGVYSGQIHVSAVYQ
jgi:hypothetical protein